MISKINTGSGAKREATDCAVRHQKILERSKTLNMNFQARKFGCCNILIGIWLTSAIGSKYDAPTNVISAPASEETHSCWLSIYLPEELILRVAEKKHFFGDVFPLSSSWVFSIYS